MPRPPATLYRPELTDNEQRIYLKAIRRDGLDDEIALMRTRIASLAATSSPGKGGSLEQNRLLCRMMECLGSLIRVQNMLGGKDDDLEGEIAAINNRFLEAQRKRRDTG
jgi:hypothetical protein